MKIGYIRVSTQEQNTIRQEVLMESLVARILTILGGHSGVGLNLSNNFSFSLDNSCYDDLYYRKSV